MLKALAGTIRVEVLGAKAGGCLCEGLSEQVVDLLVPKQCFTPVVDLTIVRILVLDLNLSAEVLGPATVAIGTEARFPRRMFLLVGLGSVPGNSSPCCEDKGVAS